MLEPPVTSNFPTALATPSQAGAAAQSIVESQIQLPQYSLQLANLEFKRKGYDRSRAALISYPAFVNHCIHLLGSLTPSPFAMREVISINGKSSVQLPARHAFGLRSLTASTAASARAQQNLWTNANPRP